MRNKWMAWLAATAMPLALCLMVGCGSSSGDDDDSGTPTPTPTPTPNQPESDAPATGAAISYVGGNNPSDNALCVQGGSQTIVTWTGTYTTSHVGGETRAVGDPNDLQNNLFVAEVLGDAGTPADPNDDGCYNNGNTMGEVVTSGIFLALRLDSSPMGNYRETVCYIIIPDGANDFVVGTLTIGAPVQGGTTPYIYCLADIDNNGTGAIETDSSGNVIAPDTEVVSVSPDGAGTIDLSAAGINDNDVISINGTANVTMQGVTLVPVQIPQDVRIRANNLRKWAVDELKGRH